MSFIDSTTTSSDFRSSEERAAVTSFSINVMGGLTRLICGTILRFKSQFRVIMILHGTHMLRIIRGPRSLISSSKYGIACESVQRRERSKSSRLFWIHSMAVVSRAAFARPDTSSIRSLSRLLVTIMSEILQAR